VFKPGDAHELASKIQYAAQNRDAMKTMGLNNRTMTETKHDYYACKDIIVSLIKKVCKDAN